MAKQKKETTIYGDEYISDLEQELQKNEKRGYKTIIDQIESEYQIGWWLMKPKFDEWALRLKLLNNQKRDKEAVGDPLLFTIHQTVLASLYSDRLLVTFSPRESGDEQVADNLTDLAKYDYDEMQKDILDYEWDWDAGFFGRGFMLNMNFDRDRKVPVPTVIDPMTLLRDPDAVSINGRPDGSGRARFFGWEARMTKREMEEAGNFFNLGSLKYDNIDTRSIVDENHRLRNDANGLSDIKNLVKEGLKGENRSYRVLNWFTFQNGKPMLFTLANNRKLIIRRIEVKTPYWPVIDRTIYPISHSWDSVSIPDLVEDKQRGRSVVQNMALKDVKASQFPMYLYDKNKIKNKSELNFGFNKFIGVDGSPQGTVDVMRKDTVKQDVAWILDQLSGAAERANATPELQQGIVSDEKRTLGELQLVEKKSSTRYSLSAKIFGWSEKRFWRQWYDQYKMNFQSDIDEKIVRISGSLRYGWRPLKRENIIANVDPDVKIESRVIADAERFNNLQAYLNWVNMVINDPNANKRLIMRHIGRLSGFEKDVIEATLPPSIDELQAEEENRALSENKKVVVKPSEDHIIHLNIHARADDTPALQAHITAHKKALMVKRDNPALFPQTDREQFNPSEDVMSKLSNKVGQPAQSNA